MDAVRSWRELAPMARDAVLAAAAAAVVFGAAVLEGAQAPVAVLALLSAGVAAPLVLRVRFPLSSAVATAVVSLAGLGVAEWSGRLVVMGAFCSAAYHGTRPLPALAASVGWFLAVSLGAVAPSSVAAFAEIVVTGIAPVAVGVALRGARRYAEQTARLHHAEAARTVAEERAAVARDVHDAVGHHLTAIRMQAAAVHHVVGPDALPPVAGRALAVIDDVAASAVTDVRAVLAALREPPMSSGATLDAADVRALADRLSTPGCPVRVAHEGADAPAAVSHGGYRLLQEAVTNAVRHAGASAVDVRVAQGRDAVTITVEDDGGGPPPGPDVEGSGIRGMRERARLLGGTLEIGPRHPAGWRVEARLPTGKRVR
ncbi:sensor histidine kinase [Pseudonocardia sichuanensis]